ncbi:MAG: hypothetical protein ABEI31_05755 [Halodesulfurarchaeum sp.]
MGITPGTTRVEVTQMTTTPTPATTARIESGSAVADRWGYPVGSSSERFTAPQSDSTLAA